MMGPCVCYIPGPMGMLYLDPWVCVIPGPLGMCYTWTPGYMCYTEYVCPYGLSWVCPWPGYIYTYTRMYAGETSSSHKVVMLTGDRNLRVKAHANHQPVKDIPNFMALLTK